MHGFLVYNGLTGAFVKIDERACKGGLGSNGTESRVKQQRFRLFARAASVAEIRLFLPQGTDRMSIGPVR